jgi:hypothetical protein
LAVCFRIIGHYRCGHGSQKQSAKYDSFHKCELMIYYIMTALARICTLVFLFIFTIRRFLCL